MGDTEHEVVLDCEMGRQLGCSTFCCRLLVRLEEDEREPSSDGQPSPGFVPKDESGKCIHCDADTGRCGIWENRPRICRAYDCNHDPLLQIVLRDGFRSLVELAKASASPATPSTQLRHIPKI